MSLLVAATLDVGLAAEDEEMTTFKSNKWLPGGASLLAIDLLSWREPRLLEGVMESEDPDAER
jgi:hypothetical protein